MCVLICHCSASLGCGVVAVAAHAVAFVVVVVAAAAADDDDDDIVEIVVALVAVVENCEVAAVSRGWIQTVAR